MAAYRGVNITTTWQFNDLGHENIDSSKIINIFSDGTEDIDGIHGGGVICSSTVELDSSYDVNVTNNGTYYKIENPCLYTYPTQTAYGYDYHTYKIPKGYYFGAITVEYYYEGTYDDGSSFSSYEPSTIGISPPGDDAILFVSSLSFSSMLSKISGITLKFYDYDADGEDDYWYSDGYKNMLFYAVTDILFKEYYPSDTNGNSGYSYEYISGTAAYVKGSATVLGESYSVRALSSYSSSYDDCYHMYVSAISLSTPYSGKNSTISVTSPYNTKATKYGYPITYKYEYSINGGTSWTNIASSTATSYSFTVPSNATTIMVRVTPSDSLGTGSAVTSNSYTVQKPYFIYAGKNGVNTITSARVGVGGGYARLHLSQLQKTELLPKLFKRLHESYISCSHRLA